MLDEKQIALQKINLAMQTIREKIAEAEQLAREHGLSFSLPGHAEQIFYGYERRDDDDYDCREYDNKPGWWIPSRNC